MWSQIDKIVKIIQQEIGALHRTYLHVIRKWTDIPGDTKHIHEHMTYFKEFILNYQRPNHNPCYYYIDL